MEPPNDIPALLWPGREPASGQSADEVSKGERWKESGVWMELSRCIRPLPHHWPAICVSKPHTFPYWVSQLESGFSVTWLQEHSNQYRVQIDMNESVDHWSLSEPEWFGGHILNFWGWYHERKPYIVQVTSNQDCMPKWKFLFVENVLREGEYEFGTWVLLWGPWLVFWLNLEVIYNCYGSIDLRQNLFSKKIKTKEFWPTASCWRQGDKVGTFEVRGG